MADTIPTLMLYGVCGDEFDGYTAKGVAEWLNANADAAEIEVRINSGGGFVDEGTAIYNLLAGYPGKKKIRVDGIAASMAAVIAMAGDERVMGTGTMLMIHNPWTVTMGDSGAHRKEADTLDKFAEQHARIFAKTTGKPVEDVQAWMQAETWFEASEAVEHLLATASVEADAMATEHKIAEARIDFLGLANPLPCALLAAKEHFPLAEWLAHRARARHERFAMSLETAQAASQGLVAPIAAVEVTLEKSMTVSGPSAAITPAEQIVVEQPPVVDVAAAKADATNAERARGVEIRRMVAAVKQPNALADKLVADGVSIEDARKAVIDAVAAAQTVTQPEGKKVVEFIPGADEAEKWLQGAQEWILVKAGLASMVKNHSGAKLNPGEFRGMTLLDIAKDGMARNGLSVRGLDKRDLVGRAFTMRGEMPGNSTSDFAVLLENTMHKVLQAAYATQPDTWSRFCAIGSVSDFRAHNRYRKGSFGTLDTVNESQEFKRKQIPDGEKGVISLSTKGNIIAITRQAIINDDLSAFNDLAVMFGRAARLSIEVDVYTLLTSASAAGPTLQDGYALFSTEHANIAGSSAAPTVDSFDAARVLMASQRDVSGNEYLNLRPTIWVGPLAKAGAARVVNDSQYDPDTANKLQRPNISRGLLTDIVDTPRLSGNRWYMFASPDVAPVLEVAFLDGVQEPFVDTMEGWSIDGTEMKVRLDYGVAAVDYRGAITNPGA
jgi:ATP-dependent protease ClpP protease subunit